MLLSHQTAPSPGDNGDFPCVYAPFDPTSAEGQAWIAMSYGTAADFIPGTDVTACFVHDECVRTACCEKLYLTGAIAAGQVERADHDGRFYCVGGCQ